jgi:hypothetical protein
MSNEFLAPGAKSKPKRRMRGAPEFIHRAEEIEEGQYDVGEESTLDNKGATVLPRMTNNGGIVNSDNPYGYINIGSSFDHGTGKSVVQPLAERIPSRMHRAGETLEEEVLSLVEAVEPVVTPAPVEVVHAPVPTPAPIEKGATVYTAPSERDISYLQRIASGQEAYTPAPVHPISPIVPVMLSAEDILTIPRKKIPVRISGSKFGKYRGHYLHIVVSSDFLVMFYDTDGAGFEPPTSDANDPITVSCEGAEHKVYYMGMDFDLQINNLGMQIYIKHKEK